MKENPTMHFPEEGENQKKKVEDEFSQMKEILEQKQEHQEQKNEQVVEKQESKSEKEDNEIEKQSIFRRLSLLKKKYPNTAPVEIPKEEKSLLMEVLKDSGEKLKKKFHDGLGITPSHEVFSKFWKQLWVRDFGHAAVNFYIHRDPKKLEESFNSVFKYQREDGMLPLRVEKVYALTRFLPYLNSKYVRWDWPIFKIVENLIKRRAEHPVYEGQAGVNAEDTVPAVVIAMGEYALASPEGAKFAKDNFDKLEKAVEFFKGKVDAQDGLAKVQKLNPDWADSIERGDNKLTTINIWWARSLRLLSSMADQQGNKEKAIAYRKEFNRVKESIMEKLYHKGEGEEQSFFRASDTADDQNRMDTVASIFGSLYFLDATEAVKVQKSIKDRVTRVSGLANFDPPYPREKIMGVHKLIKFEDYHNGYVWPWVKCQNIQVKIKIALEHPDESTRLEYKREAVADLVDMAKLFKEAGGAYEVFRSDKRERAKNSFQPVPNNLMGNLAAFEGAYDQVKSLGWIE